MTELTASFVLDPTSGRYLPANSNANAVTSLISNRFPREQDMLVIRSLGYTPRLTNGQEIGRVDVQA